MNFLRLTLLIVLALGSGAQAGGRIVPLDQNGHATQITHSMNRTLKLADSLGPRGSITLYALDDSSHALVIWSQKDNRLTRSARRISASEVATLRQSVTEYLRADEYGGGHDLSGRGHFLRSMALLSAGFYSWAVPLAILNASDDEPTTGHRDNNPGPRVPMLFSEALLVTSLGIGTAAAIGTLVPMPEGAARLGVWGGTRGILGGALYYQAFQRPRRLVWTGSPWYGEGVHRIWETESNDKGITTPLFMSLGGLGTGLALGYATDLSAGDAAVIGVCGDAGLIGGGLGALSRHRSGQFDFENRGQARTALLGGVMGLGGGALLSRLQSYSVGDALIVRSTATLGALLPLGIATSAGADMRTAAPLALGGLAAGIAAGHYLTRDWDYTPTDGLMTEVALLAGGAATFAVASVLRPMFDTGQALDEHVLAAFAVGATATTALAWRHIHYHRLSLDEPPSWKVELAPQLSSREGKTIPMLGLRLEM